MSHSPSPLYEPIGRRIQRHRKQRQWSQQDLADKLGIHYTTVGAHERAENEMNLATAISYADVFGVTLDALVGRSTDDLLTIMRTEPVHFLDKDAVKGVLAARSLAEAQKLLRTRPLGCAIVGTTDVAVDARTYREAIDRVKKKLQDWQVEAPHD